LFIPDINMTLKSSSPSSFWGLPASTAGILAIALAATLWAIAANVARLVFDAGVQPQELAMARAVIAAVGLAIATRLWRQRKIWDGQVLALGLSLALVTLCYYVAIARLSVAIATVVQYTGPALVVGWVALKTRRRPSTPILLALVAALSGVGLVAGVFSSSLTLDPLGLMAAGFSALFFTSYTLLSEALVGRYGSTGVMARGFLISSLVWVALQIPNGFPVAIFQPQTGLGILFVGIAGTLMPFCLYCWGIEQVASDRAAIAATLEPVVATVIAWYWLGQTLSAMQLIGSVLVLIAVLLIQLQTRSTPPVP
jgi:drug/metabolite transporter, DME family